MLVIEDNGCGIKASDLSRVFEKGFTGSNRNKANATGMGLYLSKKISDKLGLKLDSTSKEEEYTRLTVATVYKGNIIKNLIMDCQSYTKYRPNETMGGIFVSWRRKEELPTGA